MLHPHTLFIEIPMITRDFTHSVPYDSWNRNRDRVHMLPTDAFLLSSSLNNSVLLVAYCHLVRGCLAQCATFSKSLATANTICISSDTSKVGADRQLFWPNWASSV